MTTGYIICSVAAVGLLIAYSVVVKTKEFWDCRITSDNKPLRIKIRNICGDETVWEVN